jgi:uncharacterized surface protein with fasciclin (FAS1) repeats
MGNLMETLITDGRFNTFVSAIQAANLVETLVGKPGIGPFTVFAPTDDAFVGLPEGKVEALLADVPELTNLVTYHLVPGVVTAAEATSGGTLRTVQGQDIEVRGLNGNAYANDARVIDADLRADDGIIHAIDTVLLPPKQ